MHRDQNRMFKWRKIATFAEFELLLKIAGEIVMPRELNRRTKWSEGLHENFTGPFAATGTTSDLSQKLKCPLAGTEIRKMQSEISIDDSNQCDIGKMKAFRDHLCSNQDVDLAGAKSEKSLPICVFAGHGIRIHAADHSTRK